MPCRFVLVPLLKQSVGDGKVKLRAQVEQVETITVGVAYAMSANYPLPNMVVTSNSGIEVAQKNNLVLSWD